MGPFVNSFIHVCVLGAILALPVHFGLFDSVFIESGLDHYAEKPWPFLEDTCPWLPMPANTVVNIGYVLVGLYWVWQVKGCVTRAEMSYKDAYVFSVFCWMAVMYGPVQLIRILTQRRMPSILDQWYTLPFFAWVIVWSYHIKNGWSPGRMIFIMIVSSLSYSLVLVSPKGFEMALAINILVAIISGTQLYNAYPNKEAKHAFWMSIFCCAGFVVIKLADHHLPAIGGSLFNYLSGHFWSKICDFLQIHYVCMFFYCLNLSTRRKPQVPVDDGKMSPHSKLHQHMFEHKQHAS